MNNNNLTTQKDIYSDTKEFSKSKRDPDTFSIIGLAMEVHNTIGPGFLEAVYQEALELELISNQIPHNREEKLNVYYKTQKLKTFYKADFICFENLIVELKSTKQLSAIDEAQVINYLKASGLHKALLINFGAEKLQFKRFIYS
jgi:GxxExxY protein